MRNQFVALVGCALAGISVTAQCQVTFTPYNIGTPTVQVYNDRIGNSRFFIGPNTDRLRVSTFVTPSPDSDAITATNAQGQQFRSTNGLLTSVTVTHPSFGTLTNPRTLGFVGLTSTSGGGRNEYSTAFNRADPAIAPLLDAWDATPFSITIINTDAPNGITSVAVTAPDFDKNAMPAFVTDLSVTGGGLTPKLDWVVPPLGPTPSAVVIQVRRIDQENADRTRITAATLVHAKTLAANATTYTFGEPFSNSGIPGFPLGFEFGKRYELTVQLEVNMNGVVKGKARTFFEYSPIDANTGNVAVFLPSVGPSGEFKFDIAVNATDTVVIDPDVAVGYIYSVGQGDPNFRSVSLPAVGDNQYVIDVFDPGLGAYRPGLAAVAGQTYNFVTLGYPDGVSKFRVKGIEASAALDARNTTAFLTTVGFMSAGRFTGTMTPVTSYVTSDFLPPVNVAPSVNTRRAGATLPLKWTLADKQGFAVSDLNAVASIAYKLSTCAPFTTDPTGAVQAQASGGTALRFDVLAGQYVFNWKTPSTPGCYALFVTLDSGQVLNANVMLRN
jgi:hypothetical protein